MERLEYFYIIRHKTTGKRYAGCSYGKECHPSKFWKEYFTSSKAVQDIILNEGKDAFEILKLIPRPLNDAVDFENAFLLTVDAARSEDWLNLSNGRLCFYNYGPMSEESKLKMALAKIGTIQSEETKQRRSNALKGRARPEDIRLKISESRKGIQFSEETKKKMSESALGKVLDEETKLKISEALKGNKKDETTKDKMKESAKNRKIVICPYCDKSGVANALKRWHFENCKKKPA